MHSNFVDETFHAAPRWFMADVFPWQRKRNRFLLCALFESQPNYICTRPRHQPTSQGLGRFDLCKSCIISFNWNTIPRARKKSRPRSSYASDFIRGLGNEPFDDRMSSDETGQICKWGVVTWLRKCPLNGFFFDTNSKKTTNLRRILLKMGQRRKKGKLMNHKSRQNVAEECHKHTN